MSDHTTLSDGFYVYVVSVPSGAIKIGVTNQVAPRIAHIQSNNHEVVTLELLLVCKDEHQMLALEAVLHQRYFDQRIHREWFAVDMVTVARDVDFALSIVETGIHAYDLIEAPVIQSRKTMRASDGQQRVVAHLTSHPEDAALPLRALGEKVGVNKDTASAGRKAWQALQQQPVVYTNGHGGQS